jgi:hypothetical protein
LIPPLPSGFPHYKSRCWDSSSYILALAKNHQS